MATQTAPRTQETTATIADADDTIYPESDGKRMADSMEQANWMTLISSNLAAWYRDDTTVLVAIDLLWYPVQGKVELTLAPDVMVVFGRPKLPRPSYKQWEEGNIAPQVVFEIISASNSMSELLSKFAFYQTHGVEEFYLYNPETGGLDAVLFLPDGAQYFAVANEWTSPRLGVRFVPQPRAPMELYLPDGEPFRTLAEQIERTQWQDERAQRAVERAEREAERAERESERAESERAAKERLAAKLRELGIDPDAL